MDNNQAADSGLSESFILSLIAALGGIISLIFASLRKSRCGLISCCCFKCQREVLTAAELELEPPSPHVAVKI
jgi:hypothetical protein